MFEKTTRINLTLPRSWNQCTTEQLETIAACLMKHTALADRFHPFDWEDVKTELFFLLTETEIVNINTKKDDSEDVVYVCRQATKKKGLFKSQQPTFDLRVWQVHYWIDTQLKWLDDENQTLILFPYKQLLYTRHWQWRWPFLTKEFLTPAELLQDFTWQQYRHLQDYMSMYVDQQNTLVKLSRHRHNLEQAAQMQKEMRQTRNEFLAVLFLGKRYFSESGGSAAAKQKVCRVSEVQWQVILLWWSGLMHYLMQQYPRCFKSTAKKQKNKKPPNPLELYTSIVATMQKYVGIDEESINNQTFHIILEQLERIAKENEEIEKMNRKHK